MGPGRACRARTSYRRMDLSREPEKKRQPGTSPAPPAGYGARHVMSSSCSQYCARAHACPRKHSRTDTPARKHTDLPSDMRTARTRRQGAGKRTRAPVRWPWPLPRAAQRAQRLRRALDLQQRRRRRRRRGPRRGGGRVTCTMGAMSRPCPPPMSYTDTHCAPLPSIHPPLRPKRSPPHAEPRRRRRDVTAPNASGASRRPDRPRRPPDPGPPHCCQRPPAEPCFLGKGPAGPRTAPPPKHTQTH